MIVPTSAKVGIAGFLHNNKARLQKCNRAFFMPVDEDLGKPWLHRPRVGGPKTDWLESRLQHLISSPLVVFDVGEDKHSRSLFFSENALEKADHTNSS